MLQTKTDNHKHISFFVISVSIFISNAKTEGETNYEYEFRYQQDSNTYRKSNPG